MLEKLIEIESVVIAKFGWPSWALRLLSALSALVVVTAIFDQMISFHSTKLSEKDKKIDIPFSFRIFQFQYLSVYLITMLADWLQGTNMYTLYTVSSYLSHLRFSNTLSLFASHMVSMLVPCS